MQFIKSIDFSPTPVLINLWRGNEIGGGLTELYTVHIVVNS
jgi:hypothetical protein